MKQLHYKLALAYKPWAAESIPCSICGRICVKPDLGTKKNVVIVCPTCDLGIDIARHTDRPRRRSRAPARQR